MNHTSGKVNESLGVSEFATQCSNMRFVTYEKAQLTPKGLSSDDPEELDGYFPRRQLWLKNLEIVSAG